MTVFILGSVEENFRVSEHEFNHMVDFAYKHLKLPNTLDIKFEFEFLDDWLAFCHNHECNHNEYVVILSPQLDWTDLARCIFHEMAHIKQFLDKRLSGYVWEGRPYDPTTFERVEDLPWEIDALEKEDEMFRLYVGNDA